MKKFLFVLLTLLTSLVLFTSCPTPDDTKTSYTIPAKVNNFIERNNVDKINPKLVVIDHDDKRVLLNIKNENNNTYEDFLVNYIFIEWLEDNCLQPKFGYSYAKEPISFEINALSSFKHDQRIYEILNVMFPDASETKEDNTVVKYKFKDYSAETYKDAVSKIDDLFWECKTETVKYSESTQGTIYPFDLLQLFKIYKFASLNANQYYYGLTSVIKNSFDDYDSDIVSYLRAKGADSILEENKE